MKHLTEYGKNLVDPWDQRASRDDDNGEYTGTHMYEVFIYTVEDAAAWCLLTYHTDALITVGEWYIYDGAEKVWGIDTLDLLRVLSKCITN